ncbi:MAG: agmatine deiminase family protein [Nitrospinales bacterium]
MPAEWEPHAATWLTWPHNLETWPGQDIKTIENVYLQIIRGLESGEKVNLLVNDEKSQKYVDTKLKLQNLKNIETFIIPTNDSWIRDYGPNFISKTNSSGKIEIAINKWHFNSWGDKYEWELDDQASTHIRDYLKLKSFETGIVLEPGAIEVNGKGICITTEDCLLNSNRNCNFTRKEIENLLKIHLDVTDIVWCRGDIVGDDTDGHIDNLMRFVNTDTILCASEDDLTNPNYPCLKTNLEKIAKFKKQDGKKFNIDTLPMPKNVGDANTQLPASYANFYIGNKVVLLPTFNQPGDKIAHATIQKYFSDRDVIDINCNELLWGLGGIHCITQQQPAITVEK